jgi:hypothetical protein
MHLGTVIVARCDRCGRRDPELAKWLPPRAFFRGISVGALLVAALIALAHAIYY